MLIIPNKCFPMFQSRKPLRSLCYPMPMPLKAVLSILCVSNAVFPSLKQNLMQVHCSFKSAIRESRIILNTHKMIKPFEKQQRGLCRENSWDWLRRQWYYSNQWQNIVLLAVLGPSGESQNFWICLSTISDVFTQHTFIKFKNTYLQNEKWELLSSIVVHCMD
jgi:hypothetical protein